MKRLVLCLAGLLLVLASCNQAPRIPEESWCKEDPATYQMLLRTAIEQKAAWTNSPMEIGRHFFYLTEKGITDHKVDMQEEGELVKLVIINKYSTTDRAVKELAYETTFQKLEGSWTILNLRHSSTCREGRTEWGCEQCR